MSKPVIQKLTAEAFAPFGDVIQTSSAKKAFAINEGNTQRYHDIANIDTLMHEGKTIVSIFRSTPLALPLEIKMLERHPISSQAFIPMGAEPYLVIVAPKGELDESKISLFLAQSHQGVNYHTGTWHHYSLALNQESDFLVIDREGEGKNCDEVLLTTPFTISAAELASLC